MRRLGQAVTRGCFAMAISVMGTVLSASLLCTLSAAASSATTGDFGNWTLSLSRDVPLLPDMEQFERRLFCPRPSTCWAIETASDFFQAKYFYKYVAFYYDGSTWSNGSNTSFSNLPWGRMHYGWNAEIKCLTPSTCLAVDQTAMLREWNPRNSRFDIIGKIPIPPIIQNPVRNATYWRSSELSSGSLQFDCGGGVCLFRGMIEPYMATFPFRVQFYAFTYDGKKMAPVSLGPLMTKVYMEFFNSTDLSVSSFDLNWYISWTKHLYLRPSLKWVIHGSVWRQGDSYHTEMELYFSTPSCFKDGSFCFGEMLHRDITSRLFPGEALWYPVFRRENVG